MMSSGTRAAKAGKDKASKNAAQNTKSGIDGKIVDSPNPKIQPTAEQLRLAQIINDTKESDDPELKNKIDQVTELTGKTRDEAVVALHDCDNDPNRAIEMLLDGEALQGEWELPASKKKKNRPTVNANKPAEESTPNVVANNKENRNRVERGGGGRDQEKDHDNTRSRGPPRLNRGGSNRGWKGREHEKNERNLEERNDERNMEVRGRGRMMNGPGRGRGRSGPRSRTFQNRGASQGGFPRSIETWSNSTADHVQSGTSDNTMSVGNWGDSFPPTEDWDNEDWTGSLSETKVFSSSVLVSNNVPPLQDSTNTSQSIDLASLLQKSGPVTNSLPNSVSTSQPHSQFLSQATESLKSAVGIGITSAASQPTSYQSASSLTYSSSPSFPAAKFSSSPSFSSMSISTSQPQPALSNSSATCLSGISSGAATSRLCSTNGNISMLPQRPKSQKTRLPPPSKIPSSAVEMPDDAITSLDVQFGALEFGSDPSSFEFASENSSFQSTAGSTATVASLVTSMANSPTAGLSTSILASQVVSNKSDGTSVSAYTSSLSSSKPLVQNSLPLTSVSSLTSVALGQSSVVQPQKTSESDLIPFAPQTEKKPTTSFGNQRTAQTAIEGTALSSVGKPDTGLVTSFVAQNNPSVGYQPSYQGQKTSYSSHQPNMMSSNSYRHSSLPSNTSGVSPQAGLGSQTSAGFSVAQNQVPIASYSSGPTVSYPSQVQTSFSTATQATPSYQGQVASTSQPSQATYQPQNQVSFGAHQTSSLAQATSTGFSSSNQSSQNSAYGSQSGFGSVSTVQTHTSLHASVTTSKLSSSLSAAIKDSSLDSSSQSYDNCHVTSSGNSIVVTSTTASSITSGSINVTSGLSLPTGSSMNSTTTNTAKMLPSSKAGLPNMPPGVPVVGHQYIMSQASMPIYGLQPQCYAYDDVPVVPRLPMQYAYDLAQFPSATGLTGRDGLANVAYSAADGKYSRGDNSSPVPTTLSQQQTATQQHQQAYINTAIPPGYGYYYPSGVVPSFAQYGTPIFPVPSVTNSTNNTQFQKPAYGSHGYASGYDNITQTQDYKGGYSSGSQSQTKGVSSSSSAGGSSSGTDMSGSVYSKTHNQLGKPFDKPGFATGTPPPFNMPGTQAGPMGTPSTPYPATAFIAMMQHPSPMMHHQMHQESQGTGSQRSNSSSGQQKSTSGPKPNFSQSYWANN